MNSMRPEHAVIFGSRISRRLLDNRTSAHSPSRITLSFALGTILVLLSIFTITIIFSCLSHYSAKIRRAARTAFFRRNAIAAIDGPLSTPNPPEFSPSGRDSHVSSIKVCADVEKIPGLPVVMPGDSIPKFIAWPCSYVKGASQSSAEVSSNELSTSETPQPSQDEPK